MTDALIKALEKEIHIANDIGDVHSMMIRIGLIKDALDLINRLQADKEALINGQETLQKHIAEQKAEIERLKDDNDFLESRRFKEWQEVRDQTIKEFTNYVKNIIDRDLTRDLTKEMTEVDKNV